MVATSKYEESQMNDALLESFIKRFFGYGDLAALIWFVGMEEGGSTDRETQKRQLDSRDI